MYFRLTETGDDLVSTKSIEIESISIEDLASLWGAEIWEMTEAEILEYVEEYAEENDLLYDGDTLRWDGVCCCDSIESLSEYISGWCSDLSQLCRSSRSEHLPDKVIIEFEGEWINSCAEGEVVRATRIITTHPIEVLS